MWARPNGDEYYRWALKASTTITTPPEEIHQIGLDTLRSLHAQMDTILKGIGYSQGGVGARMQALQKDPRYRFPWITTRAVRKSWRSSRSGFG